MNSIALTFPSGEAQCTGWLNHAPLVDRLLADQTEFLRRHLHV